MKEFKAAVRFKQIDLLQAYLRGKTIEYSPKDEENWSAIPCYEGPLDVARLSGKDYKFRIKSENT